MANQHDDSEPQERRKLSPAAKRALAEAKQRQCQQSEQAVAKDKPQEVGGRKGPDPVRYGDWEKKGIVSDF